MKIVSMFVISVSCLLPMIAHAAQYSDKIMTCGYNSIIIYDISNKFPKKIWSFNAPKGKRLGYSGCRMIDNNSRILATSSFSGVDIINIAQKKINAHWDLLYAHSARLIDSDKILAASEGHGTQPGGLFIFDVRSPNSAPITYVPWSGAHTILMNNDPAHTFWIMNGAYIAKFGISNLSTSHIGLVKLKALALTSKHRGAHDATFTQDGSGIIFSDIDNVYTFNPNLWRFSSYENKPLPNVKSLDINKENGLLMYVEPEGSKTGTNMIKFGNGVLMKMPTAFYKARWVYGKIPSVYHSE